MATKRRFATTSEEDIQAKRLKLNSDNTIKANKKAANILRDYLHEKNQPSMFESFDTVRLNEVLGHFYMDVRKPDGDRYKTTSFESIRHGLNRYLKSPPYNKSFDIVKDKEFDDANTNFRAVMTELKRLGKAEIQHHPVISESDRQQLYGSMYLNPDTPTGLANKVQFDIRLYFFRRGMENMWDMKKTDFKIETDMNTGLRYVVKTSDELTKNHRETDKENTRGVMPESPDSPYCPVKTFEKYINKLNPSNECLWQKPLDSFYSENEAIWYSRCRLGEKTLAAFMSNLSKTCKLSKVYTNHSIRATGATILSKSKFGPAQIMSVTGHKSVQSLTTYQRVDTQEKIKMGLSISESINPSACKSVTAPPSVPALQYTRHQQPALPVGTVIQDLIPVGSVPFQHGPNQFMHELQGIDLDDILCEYADMPLTSNPRNNIPAAFGRSQCFYGNVTIIHNLTVNK